jgi:hypothetical protein
MIYVKMLNVRFASGLMNTFEMFISVLLRAYLLYLYS